MLDNNKPLSGFWIGFSELVFFAACVVLAAIPVANNFNEDERMGAVVSTGIAATIFVVILSKIFKNRGRQRIDLSPAQRSILAVRDHSVALILMGGAAPAGASMGMSTLMRGPLAQQMFFAGFVGAVVVCASASIVSRFWAAFGGEKSVFGGILAVLSAVGSLYGAKSAWGFADAINQLGIPVSADSGMIAFTAVLLAVFHLLAAVACLIGAKILFAGSSKPSDFKAMTSALSISYFMIGIGTAVGMVVAGVDAELFMWPQPANNVKLWAQAFMHVGSAPLSLLYIVSALAILKAAKGLGDKTLTESAG